MNDRKNIVCVGRAYIDIVSIVETYLAEDTDQRCIDYYWQRGGNASNSSTVISVLGQPVEFLGVLADDYEASWLREDFEKRGVKIDHCERSTTGRCPMTTCIVSEATGSRTITFTDRGLPELSFSAFDKVSLESVKWIHFEGRPNSDQLETMFRKVSEHNLTSDKENRIRTSMEIEQCIYPQLESLVVYPDYVFFSKDWAKARGLVNKEMAVQHYAEKVKPGGAAICGWGDQGAAAKSSGGEVVSIPAFPPERVIDTLGCGDTFVGSVVIALSLDKCLKDAIEFGCRVAGAKCGIRGVADLQHLQQLL